MSTRVIKTCDRCKASWDHIGCDHLKQMHQIEVKVSGFSSLQAEWCRDCVDTFKLFQRPPDPNANTAPGVNFDLRPASERLVDLLREIAKDGDS